MVSLSNKKVGRGEVVMVLCCVPRAGDWESGERITNCGGAAAKKFRGTLGPWVNDVRLIENVLPLLTCSCEAIMASMSMNAGYVCRRCIAGFSRQYSLLATRLRLRSDLASTDWSHGSRTSEHALRSRMGERNAVDSQRSFGTTSVSLLEHSAEHGQDMGVEAIEARPRGRIRPIRPRRMTRVVQTAPVLKPMESSDTPERSMRRQLRKPKEREPVEDLVPSKPSAPLGSTPKPTLTPTTSPQPTVAQIQKHLGGPEDFNWYWESIPPTINDKVLATRFFTNHGKNAKLLRSVAQFRIFPESDVPEVAFVGRSNVGKSSLLNAVVGADIKSLLARTSATPGLTKTMNLYGIGSGNGVVIKKQPSGRDKIIGRSGLTIVDMPGYGEGSLTSWGVEIMKYIQSRKQLRRVFVLLDAQHGIKDKDRSLLASLRLTGVSHQIILSKIDKLYIPKVKVVKHFNGKSMNKLKPKGTTQGLREVMNKLKVEIQPPFGGGALGEILACSAETVVDGKRLGIDHVRYAVLKAVGLEAGVKKPSQDV